MRSFRVETNKRFVNKKMFLSKLIVGSFAYERALAQRGGTQRRFSQMTAMMYHHNEASFYMLINIIIENYPEAPDYAYKE